MREHDSEPETLDIPFYLEFRLTELDAEDCLPIGRHVLAGFVGLPLAKIESGVDDLVGSGSAIVTPSGWIRLRSKDLRRRKRVDSIPGFVYFIRRNKDGLVKLGQTGNLKARVNQLTAEHGSLSVLDRVMVWNRVIVERTLHFICSERRVHGEWFTLSGDEVNGISGALHLDSRQWEDLCA